MKMPKYQIFFLHQKGLNSNISFLIEKIQFYGKLNLELFIFKHNFGRLLLEKR